MTKIQAWLLISLLLIIIVMIFINNNRQNQKNLNVIRACSNICRDKYFSDNVNKQMLDQCYNQCALQQGLGPVY